MNEESRLRVLNSCFGNRKSKIQWAGFLAIVLTLTMCEVAAEAQQQAKVPKIGWLGARSAGGGAASLTRELRELGYVEGKNVAFESRYAGDKLDRLDALADELVRLKVDVLVMPSTNEAPGCQECLPGRSLSFF